jgi:DNA-directed RNA polymerase specialized sigma24 family protein
MAVGNGTGRDDQIELSDLYAEDGLAAYRVALAITGHPDQAERALVRAFARLAAARRNGARSARIELLDATRRSAISIVDGAVVDAVEPDEVWGPIHQVLDAEQREVLALAVAGGTSCIEITQIMGISRGRVHRALRDAMEAASRALGLHRAVAGPGPLPLS